MRRRAAARRHPTQRSMTRVQYLNSNGWTDPQLSHHQQPWVIDAMHTFHAKQLKWEHRLCTICHEIWPTKTCLGSDHATYICTRCKRDTGEPKRFSAENDMLPGKVPPCLYGLSQVEEMLIARACPIMTVYRKHGRQRGYRGHILNVPQDIQGFLNHLPRHVNELPVLVVKRSG